MTTVRYSPAEQRMLKLLRTEPLDSLVLADRYYGKEERPYYSRQIINGMLNSLLKKTAVNREPFRIIKSRRAGPHPMTFKLERRKR